MRAGGEGDGMNEQATLQPAEAPKCKGRVYRYQESHFFVNDRTVHSRELRLLKRRSCPGCEKCSSETDFLASTPELLVFGVGLKPGLEAALHFVEVSRDWETGYVDEFLYEARPLQRAAPQKGPRSA